MAASADAEGQGNRDDTPARRLARLRAEVRRLQAERAAMEAAYKAGNLSREAYVTVGTELRGRLLALGLEMYDIHASLPAGGDRG